MALSIAVIVFLSFLFPFCKALSPLFEIQTEDEAYTAAQLLRITGYTLQQSVLSTILATAIGVPAGYLIAKKKFIGKKLLLSFSSVPLCVPPLIVALGYISTFGMAGYVNKILMAFFHIKEPPLTFLYSITGIVITQGFYNFPIIMTSVSSCWQRLDTRQEDCARLLGASKPRVFFTITLYQIFSSILSGAITVFIYCFFSFMLVLLFGVAGGTTLEVAIYQAGRGSLNFGYCALLALVETGCAFSTLLLLNSLENKSQKEKGLSFENEISEFQQINAKELPFVAALFFLIILFFLMPLLSIAIGSLTSRTGGNYSLSFASYVQLFKMKSFYTALGNTIKIALPVSIICTITGFVYALLAKLSNLSKNPFFRTLPMLPMSVSSVVMGIGITMLVHRGSPVHLILAQSALAWPFAFRQIYHHITKIPDETIDAAFSLSRSKLYAVFSVVIPYCKKGFLCSLGFCFAISAGDATLPLVLAIHKFDTLSLFTYRLAGSYRFAGACASGLVLGLICMTVFSITNSSNNKKE